MFNNRPKLPRTVTGFETQATVIGPVSYHRPLEFSPITNAVVFSVAIKSLKDTREPFLTSRSAMPDGTGCRSWFMIPAPSST